MPTALLLLSLSAGAVEPPKDPERPGLQRVVLGVAGTGAMAAATVWFFYAGDSLGAGDPASLLAGAGFIATAGAMLGASHTVVAPDEADLDGEASTPVVRMGLGYGGAPWAREKTAHGLWVDVRPRVNLGRLRLTPGLTVRQQLGARVDVDWRDQPGTTYDPALTETNRGFDADVEARVRVIEHVDGIATPMLSMRFERFAYADGSVRTLRRSMIVPLAVGFRWRISGRQYFESIAGPRWDQLAWGGDQGSGAAPAFYSPLFLSARYRIQVAHPDLRGGLLRSRFGIAYTHSNFDGEGVNVGAVIGFMGPFRFDWDTRWTPPRGPALQVGVDYSFGVGGGFGLEVGVAPRGSRP
ncbi:MAG: hypothetical protein H6737_05615 [Alphaproteobacteria bacterium]|nr:hypothetical protein [Alphaproteobacteria bacterium]